MTTAIFKQSEYIYEVDIQGHADFNKNGPDIVCSACSCLAYTLLQTAIALKADGAIRELHSDIDEETGAFYLKVCSTMDGTERVDASFETIANGFSILQKDYPKNVRFSLISGEK